MNLETEKPARSAPLLRRALRLGAAPPEEKVTVRLADQYVELLGEDRSILDCPTTANYRVAVTQWKFQPDLRGGVFTDTVVVLAVPLKS